MKILIADDDPDLVDWLGYVFRRDGHKVFTALHGEAALRVFEAEAPDLVLLDIKMPRRSGMEVLREIRSSSDVPVILLTAVGDEDRVVEALESGADDYVVKPFRPRELKARTAALLRRAHASAQTQRRLGPLRAGKIVLDPRARTVTVSGRSIQLTPTELAVLEYLILNQGTVVRPAEILENVWGYDAEQGEDTVRVAILRLRRKIEPDPSEPRYIINLPGEGYTLKAK